MTTKTYHPANPNKMFPPELTALIRFVRHPKRVPCALCQHKQKILWTMLCEFIAINPADGQFEIKASDGVQYPALTEVCTDHFLLPIKPIRDAI